MTIVVVAVVEAIGECGGDDSASKMSHVSGRPRAKLDPASPCSTAASFSGTTNGDGSGFFAATTRVPRGGVESRRSDSVPGGEAAAVLATLRFNDAAAGIDCSFSPSVGSLASTTSPASTVPSTTKGEESRGLVTAAAGGSFSRRG
ncbi:unnamed protein product [Ectocarpus sp. 12 AP-2014]